MSIIVHRCPDCRHRDIDISSISQVCTQNRCRCTTPRSRFLSSELVPTFDTTTAAPVTTTVKPGSKWPFAETGRPMSPGAVTLCGCGECVSLYQEQAS